MKRRISIISVALLAMSLVGCSNNDAEVKALQEQVVKLEQQLNESEKEAKEEVGVEETTDIKKKVVEEETYEETYICDICGKQGTCNEMECFNYIPEPVEEDVEANWEICYDCGQYFPPEHMTFNGRSYHCGCATKCPQCKGQLNDYGICPDCNGY